MDTYFQIIQLAHYQLNEPGRYYHNLEHTHQVMEACRDITRIQQLPLALLLAAKWHDVIYVPGSTTNEVASAEHLKWCLNRQHSVPQEYADAYPQARRLILATSIDNHLGSIEYDDPLVAVLLDADLAAFAVNHYDHFYAIQVSILLEAGLTDSVENLEKSAAFLSQFLAKPSIYRTEYALSEWEHKANRNIKTFIDNHL